MSVLYTTQFPPDLNDEADIKLHESRTAKGPEATGLALKGGTVLRYVEFSPGYTVCLYHLLPPWKAGLDFLSVVLSQVFLTLSPVVHDAPYPEPGLRNRHGG